MEEDMSFLDVETQKMIIHPDLDGFICGTIMNNLKNWTIEGFYDASEAKTFLLMSTEHSNQIIDEFKDIIREMREFIYLDLDLIIPGTKSVGMHALYPDFLNILEPSHLNPNKTFHIHSHIIDPNLSMKEKYVRKYPFNSAFYLIKLLSDRNDPNAIKILDCIRNPQSSDELKLCRLFLQADSIDKNIFNYYANVKRWALALDLQQNNLNSWGEAMVSCNIFTPTFRKGLPDLIRQWKLPFLKILESRNKFSKNQIISKIFDTFTNSSVQNDLQLISQLFSNAIGKNFTPLTFSFKNFIIVDTAAQKANSKRQIQTQIPGLIQDHINNIKIIVSHAWTYEDEIRFTACDL